jgi:DNA-binding transcriptional LysR family regulator
LRSCSISASVKALHRVRERLVSQRTGIMNQIRAFLLERGVAVRQGQRFLRAELPRILDDVSIMVIDSLTAQKRLIEVGIGIALLPESTIQEELRLGTLRTIDIPCLQTTVPIHVLYRKHGYLTGASRTLLSLISAAPASGRTTMVRAASLPSRGQGITAKGSPPPT